MSVRIRFSPSSLSAEQYDEVVRRLTDEGSFPQTGSTTRSASAQMGTSGSARRIAFDGQVLDRWGQIGRSASTPVHGTNPRRSAQIQFFCRYLHASARRSIGSGRFLGHVKMEEGPNIVRI
jgi:hypothetical protein